MIVGGLLVVELSSSRQMDSTMMLLLLMTMNFRRIVLEDTFKAISILSKSYVLNSVVRKKNVGDNTSKNLSHLVCIT